MNVAPSIDDRVEELVRQHWNEQHIPMLLSALGSLDGGHISRWAKLEHGGLRSFVEQSMPGKLRVVEHSYKQAVVGVVPRTAETEEIEDWDPLLENTRTSLARPRLQPAFWAAFRKPLEEGAERYVVLGDRGARFVDVSVEHRPAGGVRVPRESIVGLDASAEETHERVEGWIKENDLDIELFRDSVRIRDSQELPAQDLLGKLIGALDAEDLRKISMPMEVVAKLRRHPS